MGHRRKSREYALQGLYMHEVGKADLETVLTFQWIEKKIPDDIREFAENLIKGSLENVSKIDDLIEKHSKNWKLERISVVDKSILRLAIFEILFISDIPAAVTINEGIELGKIYGGEGSGQFINGILDAIRKIDISEVDE